MEKEVPKKLKNIPERPVSNKLPAGTFVTFIRHGEKDPKENVHLNRMGYARANEYVHYFKDHGFDCIIAMKQHKEDSSNRCYETIKPLADSLNLEVIKEFGYDQMKKNVDFLRDLKDSKKYKHILVCWEHTEIGEIIKKLTRISVHKLRDHCFSNYYTIRPKLMRHYQSFDLVEVEKDGFTDHVIVAPVLHKWKLKN